jgi:hypothetical protein
MAAFDNSLQAVAEQTFKKIDFNLNGLEKKIFSYHKKRMETVRQRIYRLATALFPDRSYQERVININHYISKYGFGIVKYIGRCLDVSRSEHQMIYLSKWDNGQ